VSAALILRDYRLEDQEAAIALWLSAWSASMPELDFSARLAWWRERWTRELVPNNAIRVAENVGVLVGFVVIDPRSGYLDQIVVAPQDWGRGVADALLEEAKHLAPAGITLDVNQENPRAIRFYVRAGFVRTGAGTNPYSGRATWRFAWKPGPR
jgi:putative acetyltransferase